MESSSITLTRYLLMQQREHPGATGEFSMLLSQIAFAAKTIARELGRAGLADVLGASGQINIQGEVQHKLDQISNDAFLAAFANGQLVSEMVSEEMEHPTPIQGNEDKGKYVIFVDPLDGSSNLDVNVTVGSIFSVHRRPQGKKGTELVEALHLRGRGQVAAGYALYGPSTTLVYTTGQGVHGFTLDRSIGDFLLSHEHIRIPQRGSTYSINEGRRSTWLPPTRAYIDHLQETDSQTRRPYSGRYIGSLVADFHRTLLKGGVFLYPADPRNARGKLRLMYEAAPLGFVVEQAGGRASDGTRPIRDIVPDSLHQRTPLIIGSARDVQTAESFYQ